MQDQTYWQNRYINDQTAWDTGAVTPPIKAYFDQIEQRNSRILIPGCGNAHEAAYLYAQGFEQVYLCDWAPAPLNMFAQQNPNFPKNQLICADFFELNLAPFDYIVEQTFFCAIHPHKRIDYAQKVHQLLLPNGCLIGLMFGINFDKKGPPYGGSKEEYLTYFSSLYSKISIEPCYNSISPRQGAELFIRACK